MGSVTNVHGVTLKSLDLAKKIFNPLLHPDKMGVQKK
jgi:hypothetical protein